jgi:hypothetical protein
VRVSCASGSTSCAPTVDGEPVLAADDTWTTRGAHVVGGTVDGAPASEQRITIDAGKTATTFLAKAPPAPPTVPPPDATSGPRERPSPTTSEHPSGLAPGWFVMSLSATALLAGAATWSTLDMSAIREDFNAASCSSGGSAWCDRAAEDGRSANLRTVILWSATGVAAVSTTVLGLATFRSRSVRVGVAPLDGGAFVAVALHGAR